MQLSQAHAEHQQLQQQQYGAQTRLEQLNEMHAKIQQAETTIATLQQVRICIDWQALQLSTEHNATGSICTVWQASNTKYIAAAV